MMTILALFVVFSIIFHFRRIFAYNILQKNSKSGVIFYKSSIRYYFFIFLIKTINEDIVHIDKKLKTIVLFKNF